MLRLIGWMIKTCVFAILVVVVSNWVRWHGVTLSDQVRLGMAHTERAGPVQAAKDWVSGLVQSAGGSAKEEARRRHRRAQVSAPAKLANDTAVTRAAVSEEAIPPSERQKLRALIQELNSSRGKD